MKTVLNLSKNVHFRKENSRLTSKDMENVLKVFKERASNIGPIYNEIICQVISELEYDKNSNVYG